MPEEITVNLLRAGTITGMHPVPKCTIKIDKEIITPEASLESSRALYDEQANVLAEALFETLPGGTIDALLIEFLKRKRSLLMVPF